MIRRLTLSEKDRAELAAVKIDASAQTDDLFDYRNVVIQKPWGHEYLIFQNNDVAAWILHMKKGFHTSTHCHPNKNTSLTVLSGEARCKGLNDEYLVRTGEGLLIDKGVFHSTQALTPDWVILMEVETPTNKQDLVRLHDVYGRAGMRYEGNEHHRALDKSLCHFNAEEERYSCNKQFGDCELSVVKCEDAEEFSQVQAETEAHLATVLSGGLRNGTAILQAGDIAGWQDIRLNGYTALPNTEILFIKKIL